MTVLVCMGPVAANAQALTGVREGAHVWITTAEGVEYEGRIAAIASTGLRLDAASGRMAFDLADVRRIEARDGLGNGMRIGAIAGALALGGFAAFLSQALCEIPDGCFPHDLGPILVMAGIGAGAGLGAGALVDHVIKGRRTLYSSESVAVRFTPSVSPSGFGGAVSVAWGPRTGAPNAGLTATRSVAVSSRAAGRAGFR